MIMSCTTWMDLVYDVLLVILL